ncbi:MAG: alpha/beta fold hydrolase [Pseudomonadota bacterium]
MTKVYFHGIPGSPADFSDSPWSADAIYCNLIDYGAPALGTSQHDILDHTPDGMLDLVAFSLGAMLALDFAARHPDKVSSVTLISAAGPLHIGDFLDQMAGGPVFRAAQKSIWRLKYLTFAQRLMVAIAPNLMTRLMFAATSQDERDMSRQPTFRNQMIANMRHAYGPNRACYFNILQTYVSDWSATLDQVHAPVLLYHGTDDTWAPLSMAHALSNRLRSAKVVTMNEKGHFGALRSALPLV